VATFHCDQNIPRALAEGLRRQGHTVHRALELGMASADDPERLLRAAHDGHVLLTKDHDFVDLHIAWFRWSAAWGLSPPPHAGILIISDHWSSAQAVQEIKAFLRLSRSLANTCRQW
jgi:hypothetical protein